MPASEEAHATAQFRHDAFIAALALASVLIGAYELLRPRPDQRFTMLDAVDLGIVLVFIIDFVVHARASGDWKRYARRHWWELPSLIPITGGMIEGAEGFAVVRGLRLVRVARLVRLARIIGIAPRFGRTRRYVKRVARRARLVELTLGAALVIALGAGAIWVAEGRLNPRLARMDDALWWSSNMFTNLAYVDYQPATGVGRVLAALLAFTGIAFIGVFTASLANAILTEPGADEEALAEPEPLLD